MFAAWYIQIPTLLAFVAGFIPHVASVLQDDNPLFFVSFGVNIGKGFWYYFGRGYLSTLPFLLSTAPSPIGPVGYFGGGAVASGAIPLLEP